MGGGQGAMGSSTLLEEMALDELGGERRGVPWMVEGCHRVQIWLLVTKNNPKATSIQRQDNNPISIIIMLFSWGTLQFAEYLHARR